MTNYFDVVSVKYPESIIIDINFQLLEAVYGGTCAPKTTEEFVATFHYKGVYGRYTSRVGDVKQLTLHIGREEYVGYAHTQIAGSFPVLFARLEKD